MPNHELTEIAVILDRSGSMSSIRADMIGGFDAFIEAQRAEPGQAVVSLYQFDTLYECLFEERPIAQVPSLNLQPRASTALLDAMGSTITSIGARLDRKPESERPGRVVVLTITDGQENASREFTHAQVRKMVEHQTERYGWQFAFLGANIDSFAVARSMGYTNMSAVMNYQASSEGVRLMATRLSRGVSNFRRANVVGTGFAPKLSFDDDEVP